MKRTRLSFIALAIVMAGAVSCNVEKGPEGPVAKGIAILNEGSYGANNATITTYDIDSREISVDVFMKSNGKALGDTGQSMLVSGDNIYIAVSGSQIVYITDRDFKAKGFFKFGLSDSELMSPRYMVEAGGLIFVTLYEGYLGVYDPSTGPVCVIKVGMNPEGLAYAGGKVYVANSGGYNYPDYDNTVSVVDVASLKLVNTLAVNTNPAVMCADKSGNYVYVHSFGNYADVPAKVQAIKVSDDSVSDLDYDSPSGIACFKDDLYVLCGGYDAMWNPLPGSIYRHDAAQNRAAGLFTETKVDNAYKISAYGDYVFVSSSDYKNTGDMFIFDKEGVLVDSFDTQGFNPNQAICY